MHENSPVGSGPNSLYSPDGDSTIQRNLLLLFWLFATCFGLVFEMFGDKVCLLFVVLWFAFVWD
jgi:hypothetical protein